MEKKPVNVQLKDFTLRNVTFDLQTCEENKEYRIQFYDLIKTTIHGDDSFSILYTRMASNDSPFKLEVSYSVVVEADKKDLVSNNESIQEFADRKKQDIIKRLRFPSRASVLISEITRDSGSILITAPGIIIDNKERKEGFENASKKD